MWTKEMTNKILITPYIQLLSLYMHHKNRSKATFFKRQANQFNYLQKFSAVFVHVPQ